VSHRVGARYEVNSPRIVAETIDGEVVAIDLDTGSYYSLDGSGAAIWQLIESGASVQEIEAAVGVAEPVVTFVAELATEGLIRPSTDGASGPRAAEASVPMPSGPFEAPRLEKFSDLEDLLLLDPVHDVDPRGWPHAPSR